MPALRGTLRSQPSGPAEWCTPSFKVSRHRTISGEAARRQISSARTSRNNCDTASTLANAWTPFALVHPCLPRERFLERQLPDSASGPTSQPQQGVGVLLGLRRPLRIDPAHARGPPAHGLQFFEVHPLPAMQQGTHDILAQRCLPNVPRCAATVVAGTRLTPTITKDWRTSQASLPRVRMSGAARRRPAAGELDTANSRNAGSCAS